MTLLNPQQSVLARIKAKFDDIAKRHHPSEVRDALDELYAELRPTLDADVAAEIEALTSEAISTPATSDKEARVKAITDIAAERERQKTVEGWTLEHDDKHQFGTLAAAGGCYAINIWRPLDLVEDAGGDKLPRHHWPFDGSWWKPKNPRRDLVKAGALIVAEIERLDRFPTAPTEGE